MTKIRVLMLMVGGLPLVAAAQQPIRLSPAQIEMPRQLGPLHLDGEPHKFDPPSYGVGYQYSGNGLSLTIYVYDAGITGIPDGGDTTPACLQFEQAKQDILGAGYADARLVSQQLARLAPPADSPLAREAVFEYVRSGQATISYLWMTAVNAHFVKMRFSLDARLREEVPDARHAILTTLGTALLPQLAPADSPADDGQAAGDSRQLVLGGRGVEEMADGLIYLATLSAAVDESPGLRPGCGGPVVPTFDAELAAYRSIVLINEEGGSSKLGQRLVKVASAGYLEEFVWQELHREDWGSAPPGDLDLEAYQAWRKKNLKRFKAPSLGAVVIHQPLPMALEPVEQP